MKSECNLLLVEPGRMLKSPATTRGKSFAKFWAACMSSAT